MEDWYPLAPKDLHTSSDDEPQNKPSGAVEDLPTPKRLDVQHQSSPSSDGEESEPVNLEERSRRDGDLSSKGRASRSSTQLRFDEQIEEPDSSTTAQERWQRTDAYMRDVQSAFRNRPAVRVQSNQRYMKLLLVGEPGLGKDLFTKNIFAPYCADNDLPVNSCEVETDPVTFLHHSTDFYTEVVVDVDDGRTKIHYMVQDTPGTHLAGADRCILKHVLRQNQEYMSREEDPRRIVPLSTLPDPRVDICLYFLSPHFFKPQDVALMTKLSELVPVVPVIARADALTTAELDAYRHEIRERLQNVSLQVGRPVMHAFALADLKAAGAVRDVPPFAVITSSEVDHEVGSHWFMRTFPWGRCEVMSSSHSDLPALKSLLFERCFEGLKAATEARFYSAREAHLTTRALSRALSSGELPDAAAAKAMGFDCPSSSRSRLPKPQPLSGPFGKPLSTKVHHGNKKKAASNTWGWPVGITIGVVTIAIVLQLATLGIYARNTNRLKTLVEDYQREVASEKQVLVDLRDILLRQEEMRLGLPSPGSQGNPRFAASLSRLQKLVHHLSSAAGLLNSAAKNLLEKLSSLFLRHSKGTASEPDVVFFSTDKFERLQGDTGAPQSGGGEVDDSTKGLASDASKAAQLFEDAAGSTGVWSANIRSSFVATAGHRWADAKRLSISGAAKARELQNQASHTCASAMRDLASGFESLQVKISGVMDGVSVTPAWQRARTGLAAKAAAARVWLNSQKRQLNSSLEQLSVPAHKFVAEAKAAVTGLQTSSRVSEIKHGFQKAAVKAWGYLAARAARPHSGRLDPSRVLLKALTGGAFL